MSREQVNRLKIVLAEEQKTNKWLAKTLGKVQATIFKLSPFVSAFLPEKNRHHPKLTKVRNSFHTKEMFWMT